MASNVSDDALALQRLYHWEKSAPDRVAMTQPTGGGAVRDYTWREVLDQTRRMAAHLQSLNLPQGSRIALAMASLLAPAPAFAMARATTFTASKPAASKFFGSAPLFAFRYCSTNSAWRWSKRWVSRCGASCEPRARWMTTAARWSAAPCSSIRTT